MDGAIEMAWLIAAAPCIRACPYVEDGMKAKLERAGRVRVIIDDLRTSLWFLPSLMMLAAALLSIFALWMDRTLREDFASGAPWWLYVGSPEEARGVLSTLLTSMITMTSLVFSITMVVLTIAARQFGPRLVRNFMASGQTQVVLGTFMMTIVYVLLVLPTAGVRDDPAMAPFLIVSVAVVLTLASIVLLVPFMHSLAKSIVSETVVEQVGAELDALIRKLPPVGEVGQGDQSDRLPADFEMRASRCGPSRTGYVQAVQFSELVALAEQRDLVVGLYFRPGDYVVEGANGIAVYPSQRADKETIAAVQRAIAIGGRRTPTQDPEFAIRHLVEIAVRSLSPSMNDPYTAIAVINRLSSSLAQLMHHSPPAGALRDDGGVLRVVCPQPTHASLLRAALDQIRQGGADKPIIVIYLLEALRRIAEHARLPEQFAALTSQVDIVELAAERRTEMDSDQASISERVASVREELARRQRAPRDAFE